MYVLFYLCDNIFWKAPLVTWYSPIWLFYIVI